MNGMRRDESNLKACDRLVRGGIVTMMNVGQTYTVSHMQKDMALWGH